MNIRKLISSDYYKDYIQLIETNNNISYNQFNDFLNHLYNNHSIYVVEINNKIIASITIIIEAKLIHHLSFVCHIEDLVIDKDYRNMGLARKLLNFAKDISKKNNCYKIILNCSDNLEEFYCKNGFYKSSVQMRLTI